MRYQGKKDYFKDGDFNAICDLTGMKCKASELVKRWDGMMVRRQSVEERHPQDFIRSVPERIAVPFSRPVADVFITPGPADPDSL